MRHDVSPAARRRYREWAQRRYEGGRPDAVARALNRLSAWHYATGILVPKRAVTLEVVGRSSGKPISFPLVLVRLDGADYLVSMLGAEANWVRNLHAAGGHAVLSHGRRRDVILTEVPIADRAPILRRYLDLAPGGRPHFPVHRGDPLEAFAPIAADYPVFRVLSPVGSGSGR